MDWLSFRSIQGAIASDCIENGLWLLSEPALKPDCRGHFYALECPDGIVLIDAGWGLAHDALDLAINGRPVIAAIATHSHSDHIGALHLVARRYGHEAEAKIFADPSPYATQARPWIDDLDFTADGTPIDPHTFLIEPCPLTQVVRDGDVLDFGGGPLHILHTPGHSPGSICIYAEREGWLFCADTVHDGRIHDDIPGADAEALGLSHSRLLDVDFRLALPGHGAIMSRPAFRMRIERYRREKGWSI
ncbi:MBL fold metallo-hydrolase [Mesorhizobium sp. RP14(2022)]|uniref:MBL fold metallo-hydrolase n=1 Tax=Mesorhizobium liriopis TaxID=2953882 RepID=A0ABT1C4T8_9HYPH|nr:MBL fold metallo-hydrolase [Mesorhizobium liriopis]MCO6049220.1 MBL fold metallo-hydrolase [Mesorhizobium liriopis]